MQGPSIFIDAEDDEVVLHRRTKAIAAHYNVTVTNIARGGLHLASGRGRDATLAYLKQGRIEPTPLYRELFEAAGDIKPRMIGIAASANVFAGNENDRSQVQQFIAMLTRVAMVANGSIVLISHPSLAGIASDSGLSGSTQWHNAVRARFNCTGSRSMMASPWTTTAVSSYSERTIMVRWLRAWFCGGATGCSSQSRSHGRSRCTGNNGREHILRATAAARPCTVSHKKSPTYAPAVFNREAEAKEAGLSRQDLEGAMRRLFAAGVIKVESFGRASKQRSRLVMGAGR